MGTVGKATRTPDRFTPDRQRREQRGRRAENLAAFWLQLKGYRILDRRAKTPHGELDLVALRGRMLVFVEVKARADYRRAVESITPQMQRRIERAAQLWAGRHKRYNGHLWRYDVVAICPASLPRHLREAWRPGL
jgi:putative endonuclease